MVIISILNSDMASCKEKILPGEIKSLPSSDEIFKLLECPCCLEPPVPPIKTCATGHIICSFCRPRLTRCAICREPYTESRNYPLETIFNGCIIACKFYGRGCDQVVSGSKFIDQYRSLCCSHCQESVSPVDHYIYHLRDKQHAIGYDEEKEVYEYKNTVMDLHNDFRFPDQYALFDGKYFIVSAQIRSHIIYIWLSLVEDLSENLVDHKLEDESKLAEIRKRAENIKYTAVISIKPENCSIPQAKWVIPVLPLQNGDPDTALIVNLPVNPTFRGFLTCLHENLDENTTEDGVREYSWCFTYCISKVSCVSE